MLGRENFEKLYEIESERLITSINNRYFKIIKKTVTERTVELALGYANDKFVDYKTELEGSNLLMSIFGGDREEYFKDVDKQMHENMEGIHHALGVYAYIVYSLNNPNKDAFNFKHKKEEEDFADFTIYFINTAKNIVSQIQKADED